jgi:hypothetical protein
MAYRLFTTWYDERNSDRRLELELCLSLNMCTFDYVHVLSENEPRLLNMAWHGKWTVVTRRQKYSDVMELAYHDANELDVCVVANTDMIIPRESLDMMQAIKSNEAYCLTRWDLTSRGGIRFFERSDSQDSWVFSGRPSVGEYGDYPFGVPGCDNRFAHELQSAGYRVLNPSRTVRTFHLHASLYRPHNTPTNRISLPYLYVWPHRLGEGAKYSRPTKLSQNKSHFRA